MNLLSANEPFPIMAWIGPGTEDLPITGKTMGDLADAGFNLSLSSVDEADPRRDLDVALAAGVRLVVSIPGDGIGPQVTAAVHRILEAAGAPVEWLEHQAGLAALENGDNVLPQATIDAIDRHRVALKGPCTTPVGEGFTSVNVSV